MWECQISYRPKYGFDGANLSESHQAKNKEKNDFVIQISCYMIFSQKILYKYKKIYAKPEIYCKT